MRKECGIVSCHQPAIVAFPLCIDHFARLDSKLRDQMRNAWRGVVYLLTKSEAGIILPGNPYGQ